MNAGWSERVSRTRTTAQADSGRQLLIVEDDASLAAGLSGALGLEGYRVECLHSGENVLERVSDTPFELVILDIGLPGIDGFEVLNRLRRAGQEMPVLVLTARDTVNDRVRALDLGADDYMVKPFAVPELAARVRALIRRWRSSLEPRTVHGPLEIDHAGRRAFLEGVPLDLAAREWEVLEILLAKVEKVVSKEMFITSLARYEEELSPNAIEVYVSRLRTKLEPAGVRIRTVRGFGYMLEEFPSQAWCAQAVSGTR